MTPEDDANASGPAELLAALERPGLGRVRSAEDYSGQRNIVLPGEVPVAVEIDAMVSALQAKRTADGLKLFSSVVAHRVLRWQIVTAHKQALEHNPDPRLLRIDGGQRSFAHDVLGLTDKSAPESVLSFLLAEDATRIPIGELGPQRLILLSYTAGKGRRPSSINHVVGEIILPDYVKALQDRMPKGLNATIAQRLVPIPDEAPLIGSPRSHAAQLTFQLLITAHFVDCARTYASRGGVDLEPVYAELAARAGLPRDLWRKVVTRWFSDGDDGPAFLKKSASTGLVTLGDAHANARAFILTGGERRNVSSDNAQARSRQKSGMLSRKRAKQ